MNYEYIDGLNSFFQTAHDCQNNGTVKLLCCLKNFILFCLRNEWIAKNPFQHYKMKIDKTNVKTILTKAEFDILIQKPMPAICARHTFACLAVEYGMPIDVLAKILGHTNTNMTRHYAKFSEKLIGKEMQEC